MEIFLTSSVHLVAKDIAKKLDLSSGNKLVFINTAAETDDDLEWMYADRKALVDAGFDVTDYTITGKLQDEIRKDLSEFDFIYMEGGDTPYLMEQSVKSGFDKLVKELVKEKIYIGTSAGSIIMGPVIPGYLTEDEDSGSTPGYGIVNFTVAPHWGDDYYSKKYLGGRLERAIREHKPPIVLLRDSQYIHMKDGQFQIVDVNE